MNATKFDGKWARVQGQTKQYKVEVTGTSFFPSEVGLSNFNNYIQLYG